MKDGLVGDLLEAGAVVKPCFCGPCFGAGDTPANNTLSIRHATRNFPNREGSKPAEGQIAAVALMDARSIAATARNGGVLTAATDVDYTVTSRIYRYDNSIYEKRVYNGFGRPDPSEELRLGPNITDWPVMPSLKENLLLERPVRLPLSIMKQPLLLLQQTGVQLRLPDVYILCRSDRIFGTALQTKHMMQEMFSPLQHRLHHTILRSLGFW